MHFIQSLIFLINLRQDLQRESEKHNNMQLWHDTYTKLPITQDVPDAAREVQGRYNATPTDLGTCSQILLVQLRLLYAATGGWFKCGTQPCKSKLLILLCSLLVCMLLLLILLWGLCHRQCHRRSNCWLRGANHQSCRTSTQLNCY